MGRNDCPTGYKEITDLFDGNDVTWSGSQPGGELADSLNESQRAAVDVLAERLDSLYDRRHITPEEFDDRLELLDRIEHLEARFVHTGPGLMGDDYTLHLCAKLAKKR